MANGSLQSLWWSSEWLIPDTDTTTHLERHAAMNPNPIAPLHLGRLVIMLTASLWQGHCPNSCSHMKSAPIKGDHRHISSWWWKSSCHCHGDKLKLVLRALSISFVWCWCLLVLRGLVLWVSRPLHIFGGRPLLLASWRFQDCFPPKLLGTKNRRRTVGVSVDRQTEIVPSTDRANTWNGYCTPINS